MINMELLRDDIVDIFDQNFDMSVKDYILKFYEVCKKHNILIHKEQGTGFVSSGEYIVAQSFFQNQFSSMVGLEMLMMFSIPTDINNCP